MVLHFICGRFLRKLTLTYYKIMGVKILGNVFISHKASIDITYRGSITIEDGCCITDGAIISAHDHSVYRRKQFSEDDGRGSVHLQKNVFVGAGAIILRNVTIGENSIVAAGAVVSRDVPPNSIVAGVPAKVIKTFTPMRDNLDENIN